MAASPRRFRAEASKTRNTIDDAIDQVMAEGGYAGVSYRSVAAKAGVVPSHVQYYFPSVDDIFISAIRRHTELNIQRLTDALRRRPDEQLRVLWEFSWGEGSGPQMSEYMA